VLVCLSTIKMSKPRAKLTPGALANLSLDDLRFADRVLAEHPNSEIRKLMDPSNNLADFERI